MTELAVALTAVVMVVSLTVLMPALVSTLLPLVLVLLVLALNAVFLPFAMVTLSAAVMAFVLVSLFDVAIEFVGLPLASVAAVTAFLLVTVLAMVFALLPSVVGAVVVFVTWNVVASPGETVAKVLVTAPVAIFVFIALTPFNLVVVLVIIVNGALMLTRFVACDALIRIVVVPDRVVLTLLNIVLLSPSVDVGVVMLVV